MRSARNTPHCSLWSIVVVAVLLATTIAAATATAGPEAQKKTSTCVACHTDAEKLKAETANIPQPEGSALQAGKG